MAHASLAPSAAERWFNCPGSVDMAAQVKTKEEPSDHAAEGSVAHEICEEYVDDKIDEIDLLGLVGEKREYNGFTIEITQEMVDGAMLYKEEIEKIVSELKSNGKAMPIVSKTEVRVKVKNVDDKVWGTADKIVYQKGHALYVIDYKYGKGVVVEPEENKQGLIYAVGAQDTEAGEAFDKIVIVIVQPRAPHVKGPVRDWEVPKARFKKFRKELISAARETEDPLADLKAGSHCRWCPAQAQCPEFAKSAGEAAQADFTEMVPKEEKKDRLPDVRLMPVEKMAAALGWKDAIEAWFKSVERRAQELLEQGEKVPGYKLVKGRSNRKIASKEALLKALCDQYSTDQLLDTKAKKLSDIEKLVGKEMMAKLQEDGVVVKPDAKNALAPESDPRPEVAPSAVEDFGQAPKKVWPQNEKEK